MNIRKNFSAQFIILIVFVIFITYTMISSFIFQFQKFNEYKSEITSLNQQINSIKKEIEELEKIENGNISEDLETIARERLNMVKPNEIVYIDIGKEGN